MMVMAAVQEELGDIEGVVVGIGPVASGVSAASTLVTHKPDVVVMVGTCGAYPGGPAIGTTVVSRRIGLAFGVAAMGLGYVPRPLPPLSADPAILARLTIPQVNVLTCGAVSTDTKLAERLADGWQVEHLEAFGVAWACHMANVPFCAILGIANIVGPNAHLEWLANREAAQQAARQVVRTLLSR
jgi:nucleoside phosphorylase